MIITRESSTRYSVVTDTLLSDCTMRADHDMRLVGNILKSNEQSGTVRAGGLMNVTLGPKSFAAVSALGIGDSCKL